VRRQLKACRREEGGEGRLKAIIYTAILVIGVFVAFKLVPLYVAQYQLKDKMEEQARFAVVNRYSEDQVRDNIFRVIEDLDIPAKREDIKVASTTHGISISVDYTSEGLDIMK